jgi:DNA-binding NarL/FixJ family response regulator
LSINLQNKIIRTTYHQTLTMPNTLVTTLSSQERKVILLIADGYKSQEIADTLCISTHTVKNHKTNICHKLNLKSTTDLLRFAILNETLLQK